MTFQFCQLSRPVWGCFVLFLCVQCDKGSIHDRSLNYHIAELQILELEGTVKITTQGFFLSGGQDSHHWRRVGPQDTTENGSSWFDGPVLENQGDLTTWVWRWASCFLAELRKARMLWAVCKL